MLIFTKTTNVLFLLATCFFPICQASDALNNCTLDSNISKELKHVKILSIDSGGTRGIIPCAVLKMISERLDNKPITEIFDFAGGTSMGCLITTALTTPSDEDKKKPKWDVDDIIKLLKDDAPSILKTLTSWNSLYDVNAFEQLVSKLCENKSFSDQIIPTVGVTFDILKLQSKTICSWNKKEVFKTSDVILASTALPVALHPRFIHPISSPYCDAKYFVGDGFLGGAGNPIKIILEKAKEYYPNAESFEVVSLGSGTMKFTTYIQALNPYNIFLKVTDIGINLVNAEPRAIKENFTGNYTRINPTFPSGGWAFDGSMQNLNHLFADTESYLKGDMKSEFDELIERLRKPRD